MIRVRCYNCELQTDIKSISKHCKESGHLPYYHLHPLDYLKEALLAISMNVRKEIKGSPINEQTIDMFEKKYPEMREADQEIDAITALGGEEKILNEICLAIESVYKKFEDMKFKYLEPQKVEA